VLEGSLQKLSDIFPRQEEYSAETATLDSLSPNIARSIAGSRSRAEGEWFGAIAALEALLLRSRGENNPSGGVILSGPTAMIGDTIALQEFSIGIFSLSALKQARWSCLQLPSVQLSQSHNDTANISEFPLLPTDPIARERFCWVLTPTFALILVLGEDEWGLPAFQFSFDPEIVCKGWEILKTRLSLGRHPRARELERAIGEMAILSPDYRTVSEFGRLILQNIPVPLEAEERKAKPLTLIDTAGEETEERRENAFHGLDIELLRALTHEIRTPLTTIRTITRLLLKRAKITEDVQKHLETIDTECSEQIDRMELIFRAAELGIHPIADKPVQLVPIALDRVFRDSVPRWQKQAKRRNISLEVNLPKKLPSVISDPHLLDQMLSGVMEKCTRGVNSGGRVKVEVSTAGNQLKLQIHARSGQKDRSLKALGQVLMFQPETGSLSLNMNVTKNLFQALGGKFIVRQKPEEEEVVTIFLPLGRGK
jgi:signal transduction histidine kinase